MGVICSCCVERDDGLGDDTPCNLSPYSDWLTETKNDWTSTSSAAISRDFPRLSVIVSDLPYSATRHVAVCDTITNLLKLCKEAGDVPEIERYWQDHVDADHRDLSGAVSHVLSNFVVPNSPSTLSVLKCMSQGVIICPMQRMKFICWMPWMTHLQDGGTWTTHVAYHESDGEYTVEHKITATNVITGLEIDVRNIPRVNLAWSLIFTVNALEPFDLITIEMKMTSITVKKTLGSTQTWDKRFKAFSLKMFSAFNLDPQIV